MGRYPYTRPLRALNTQAMAKKPTPTEAKPQPATSSYRNAPRAIKSTPTIIIIKVAQANTVFLFIPMVFSWFGCCPNIGIFTRNRESIPNYSSKGNTTPFCRLTSSSNPIRSRLFCSDHISDSFLPALRHLCTSSISWA